MGSVRGKVPVCSGSYVRRVEAKAVAARACQPRTGLACEVCSAAVRKTELAPRVVGFACSVKSR